MSDSAIQPRIVLCVLHDRPEVIEAICASSTSWDYDEEFSDCGPDERMSKAFAISWDRVQPSESDEDKQKVLHHRNVAYLISRFIEPDNAFNVAAEGLTLIAKAFIEGARAVKCESSGIAHGRKRWIELAQRNDPESLYFAYVRRPLGVGDTMYSCGMHLLGLPDTEVMGFSDWDAVRIIDSFSHYLLTEGKAVQPGHTFSCSPEDPKLLISHEECLGYERDDFFYNPYGYWKLAKPGGQAANLG